MKHAPPRHYPKRFQPRLLIALSLLTPYATYASNGLDAATGPQGTPQIGEQNGVPVIAIVAPNANGLSHNQFLDYNVNHQGLVLNNALVDGQSQLAGALGANPQFHGQAASTILNEVISRSASRIEGVQEIFGRSADYVLANPNGITINGGSFINTTRAGFLVGTPEIEDQRIKRLNTRNATGSLQVLDKGLSNAEGALELLAPKIETRGALTARDDLNLTAGRFRLNAEDGQVIESVATPTASIDASLFGAMQAGRINIVSTSEGAGVRINAPSIKAKGDINIRSAGDLEMSGSDRQRSQVNSEQGSLRIQTADDLRLTAVSAQADQIELKAGKNLTLDTIQREKITHDNENWQKKAWFVTTETYDRKRKQADHELLGTELKARGNLNLEAGESAHLTAAKVDAGGDLSIHAGKDLTLSAGIESRQVDEQIRHRKHLWRGDSDTSDYRESARPTELSGKKLNIDVANHTKVIGSTLHSSDDMQIKTGSLEVTEAVLKDNDTRKDYSGDLLSGTFFGNRDKDSGQNQRAKGSEIASGGALTVTADDVRIVGSKVTSVGDALLISEKAGLSIEAAKNQSSRQRSQNDSKLFGLIGKKTDSQDSSESVLSSDLRSESNLRLASATDLKILGSKVEAGKKLELDAGKDVEISGQKQTETHASQEQKKGFYADAHQTQDAVDDKPGSRQYNASIGYNVERKNTDSRRDAYQASELKGANVDIRSGRDVQVNGSHISADAGDLNITGERVTFGAQQAEEQHSVSTSKSGGGLAVGGGMDRISSAFEGFHNKKTEKENSSTVQRTELNASNDVNIKAKNLVSEAAKVNAGNVLAIDATTVENRSVSDSHSVETTEDNWQASLGASIEYRDLTRPVENLIEGKEASRFQQASVEDAMAPPSVGADLTLGHLKRKETSNSKTAQVTELTAGTLKVKADSLIDTGTQYRANEGPLTIDAKDHQFNAAQDSTSKHVERLEYDTALRVDTNTGEDINARLSGKGGSLQSDANTTTARPGSLYGKGGIQIQLGTDGRYEGTRFDAGDGSLDISAGGNLSFVQANDTQQESLRQLDGSGWMKIGTSPVSTGLELRGYLDNKQLDSRDSQARVVEIDAKGDVRLKAEGDLQLEGTRIGKKGAAPENIALDSTGQLKIDAATDTHEAKGNNLGGGLEIAGKKAAAGNGGGLGGHFNNGRIDESSSTAKDAQFTANNALSLKSASNEEDAVHIKGLSASAQQIDVSAENGGIVIESSTSTERRNNLDITAGIGINGAKADVPADTKKSLHARAQANLDRLDKLVHNNSVFKADRIHLLSHDDLRLEGVNMTAGKIDGSVGGDLLLASQKDRVESLKVELDVRLSGEKNPQGFLNAAKSVAGPLGGKVEKKIGTSLQKTDPKISPTLNLKIEHEQRDTVANKSTLNGRDGIDLQVNGEVKLVGADIKSSKGGVDLGTDQISKETLHGRDYRRDVEVNASNAPGDIISGLMKAYGDGGQKSEEGDKSVDLGLFRTTGHNRTTDWASNISERGPMKR